MANKQVSLIDTMNRRMPPMLTDIIKLQQTIDKLNNELDNHLEMMSILAEKYDVDKRNPDINPENLKRLLQLKQEHYSAASKLKPVILAKKDELAIMEQDEQNREKLVQMIHDFDELKRARNVQLQLEKMRASRDS